MSRVMIAATGSGSGKTTIVCGLCKCIKDMGKSPAALKCGPDYIDASFHSRVLGMKTGNLDSWFCDKDMIIQLLARQEADSDITIIEGVMGYYDGQGFSERGSSYEIADITDTPVILVVNCRGMSNSIGAVLKGYKEYRADSHIAGVIFNNLSSRLYKDAALAAVKAGITPLGYLPYNKEIALESRHLGLVTSDEVEHFQEKVDKIAEQMKETLDIAGILQLADSAAHTGIGYCDECNMEDYRGYKAGKAAEIKCQNKEADDSMVSCKDIATSDTLAAGQSDTDSEMTLRIAVARDTAFCFLYEDNMEFLRERGCELVYFSPLKDNKLPDNIDGLLLYGGYPELHAKELSENVSMREDIAQQIRHGLPCIAECGGFLYLHKLLETPDGKAYPMAGIIDGRGYNSGRLARFGYKTLTAKADTLLAAKGESFRAHEFHYWKSDSQASDYEVKKASDGSVEYAGCGTDTLYAAFPHIYFYGNKKTVERYIKQCRKYHTSHNSNYNCSYENDCYNEQNSISVSINDNAANSEKNVTDRNDESYQSRLISGENTFADIRKVISKIKGIDKESMHKAELHWNGIAKPLHGLGLMEDMIVQIAGIQHNADVNIDKKAVIVMCADNGIVEEGVTQTGQEVTAVVSRNMADGISSVCRMSAAAGATVIPVNIGIAEGNESNIEVKSYKGLINRSVMPGTKNFLKEPAMSHEQLIRAVNTGIDIVKKCSEDGYNILATGEMGIGNTTTSTALACILLELDPGKVTGRGAGLDDKGLIRKIEVITKAKDMYGIYKDNPLELLRCIGGLDIAGLVGVYIGGALYRLPVVMDGIIAAVAAFIATSVCPSVSDYILASHKGKEPAMHMLLDRLCKKPVIHAGLALGEGTGAVMLFPLLDMTLRVYKENTTFDDIQITAYEDYEKC